MKRIFIVDDDVITTNVYKAMFEGEGFYVDTAADGEIARDMLKTLRPDVVLLDLILPKVHGVEVLRYIRSEPAIKAVPVVVFSNAYLASMVKAAWAAGANMSLTKANCTPERLLEAIRTAMAGSPTPAVEEGSAPAPAGSLGEIPGDPAPAPAAPAAAEVPAFVPPPEPIPVPVPIPMPVAVAAPAPEPAPVIAMPAAPVPPPAPVAPPPPPPAPAPVPVVAAAPAPAPKPAPAPVAPPMNETPPPVQPSNPSTLYQQLRQNFLTEAPKLAATLRNWTPSTKGKKDVNWAPYLYDLHKIIHTLPGQAGIAGFGRVAQLSTAMDALLKELFEETEHINASSFRTVSQSVEVLTAMLENPLESSVQAFVATNILVIDDEVISRRTVCSALEMADFKPISSDDPNIALKILEENQFDLIFLDVNMPIMGGFELCAKIRELKANKTTPVIFATGQNDFDSRARSTMSGGNDLIAKPFLLIELAVKALTYVLKSQAKLTSRG
jgi:CheY-like chemotaxis protein